MTIDKRKIDDVEVAILLETGTSLSSCGAGAKQFLIRHTQKILRLRDQHVRTANGSKTPVTGIITLPMECEGQFTDIEFLIVPDLRQEFYFGKHFWKTFDLSVVTKSPDTNFLHICDALEFTYKEKVKSDTCLNLAHQLTHIPLNLLQKAKETFPSFGKPGLGKTHLEQPLITVFHDNLSGKQKHYLVSPAIQ